MIERRVSAVDGAIQGVGDGRTRHAKGRLQDGTVATPLIDHGQHAKGPPVGEGIVDKVHAPALAWAARGGRRASAATALNKARRSRAAFERG